MYLYHTAVLVSLTYYIYLLYTSFFFFLDLEKSILEVKQQIA